jgi:PhnB protein
MVMSKSSVPKGYQAVMPYLRVRDAASAIKFYKKVFGAKESYRLKMAGKVGHAELDVGGATIMLSDEFPDVKAVGPRTLKGTSVQLAIYVDDVDKVVAKAVRSGAKLRRAVADQFYGDRVGQIEDPFGHVWSVQTRLETVAPKDMQKRLNAMLRQGVPAARKSAAKKSAAKAARKTASKSARKSAGKEARKPARRAASAKASRRKAAVRSSPRKPVRRSRKTA